MSRSQISSKLALRTWAAFRNHCHRYFAIGYQEAISRIQSDREQETDITGYICEALEEWFRAHPDELPFFIKDDPPLRGSGRTGKRRPRTDIIISYAAGKRPEFYFEAKRLNRTPVASQYTGADGMKCFTSGRYANQCHEAAMIGYVQINTLDHWRGVLQTRVDSLRSDLQVEDIANVAAFLNSFPLEWSSSHRRTTGPLRLFHILLDCRKT
ncbi:MAG TPA: hypothetical protein VF397_09595 [Pyrinomonadaceae bacterium]